jgi:hypothetical protein
MKLISEIAKALRWRVEIVSGKSAGAEAMGKG